MTRLMATYRIVMHYKRSARTPVLAAAIPSRELAEIFVAALKHDDEEFHVTSVDLYEIQEEN